MIIYLFLESAHTVNLELALTPSFGKPYESFPIRIGMILSTIRLSPPDFVFGLLLNRLYTN